MNHRILMVLVALGVVAAGVVAFLMFQEPDVGKGPAPVVTSTTAPKPATGTTFETPSAPIVPKTTEASAIKPKSLTDTGSLGQDAGIGGIIQNEGGVRLADATCELFEDTAAIKDRTQEGESRGKQLSNSEGMFLFEPSMLSLGERYVLKVSHPMYMTERKAIDLKKVETSLVTVTLRLGTGVQGNVRTAAGQPIAGATVMVFDMNQGALDPNGSVESFVISDPSGAYVVPHLSAGIKKIQASAQGFATTERGAVQIEAGKPLAGIDFALNDGTGLSGQVVSTEGTPVVGAYVTARPIAVGLKDQNAMAHGAREIEMRREKEAQMRAEAAAAQAPVPNETTGDSKEPPPPSDGQQPPKDVDDSAAKAERKIRSAELKESLAQQLQKEREAQKDVSAFAKRMVAPTQQSGQTTISVRTLPDGTFSIAGAEFGTYSVSVSAVGFVPPPQQTVSSPSTGLVFTVSPNAHILGTVIDDETRQPVSSFTLGLTQQPDEVLIPSHTKKPFGPPKWKGGTFDYVDVKPGRYWLVADAPGYAGGRSEEIVIAQGEKRQGVEIRLVRGATIKGRVLDAKGGPVVGASVQPDPASLSQSGAAGMFLSVMMQNMRRDIRETKTDAEGRYTLPNMLSGSYTLKVSHPEYGPQTTPAFSVGNSGEVNQPDIVMSRGASVRGKVKLPDGSPDTKAMVQVAPVGTTPNFSGHRSAYTDSEGRFEVTGLAVGQYRVIVAQRNGQPDLGTLFTNLKNPNVFTLGEGEVKEMDL